MSPKIPTAIQTVCITNQPDNPLTKKEPPIEILIPTFVSIKPATEQNTKNPKRNEIETIPAITQGKNRLPYSAMTGPPKIIMIPKSQG